MKTVIDVKFNKKLNRLMEKYIKLEPGTPAVDNIHERIYVAVKELCQEAGYKWTPIRWAMTTKKDVFSYLWCYFQNRFL